MKEAEEMWELVSSWGERAAIPKQFAKLSELKAAEYKATVVAQWAKYDHFSLAAHRRAFESWAKWCSSQEEPEDPLEPTAVAFPKWLAERKAKSSPLALWNHFDWLARVVGVCLNLFDQQRGRGYTFLSL